VIPDDRILITALQQNDIKMFEKVFRHFYNPLCSYANGILSDPDEAEDVVQQTMMVVWEKRNELQINTSFKSYLYRAVHNQSLNKLRHLKVRSGYETDQMASGAQFYEAASATVARKELKQHIADAIEKLPEQCRMVFKLSRFEEMKYAEIAGHLDISVKTVENHMGKALKLLREHLSEFMIWLLVCFSFVII
jgi:RNA polymerase sigma-70 factor (ECF subfamily)